MWRNGYGFTFSILLSSRPEGPAINLSDDDVSSIANMFEFMKRR